MTERGEEDGLEREREREKDSSILHYSIQGENL